MSQTTELKSHALALTLPERVFTRTGTEIDPRRNFWEWADGTYIARIDFNRLQGSRQLFRESLKKVLLSYIRGHSA